MKIISNLKGNKVIAVVPTADHTQDRVQRLQKELNAHKVDSILVENSGPTFSFSKSMNAGIKESLNHQPDCVILSNDDVWGIEGIDGMINYVLSHDKCYAQPYLNGRKPVVNVTTSPLKLFFSYTLARKAPFYAYKFTLGIMKLTSGFALGIPSLIGNGLVSVQPFGVFKASTLEDEMFDENFHIYVEDDEFAYRLSLKGIHGQTNPSWRIRHDGGTSLGKGISEDRIRLVASGASYFYTKHFKTKKENKYT